MESLMLQRFIFRITALGGMLIFQMTEAFSRQEHYIMMDEKGMNDYRFFRKIGAFSVNKKSPKDILRSLNYAEKLLSEKNAVWLFPQGKIEHPLQTPFTFESGLGHLIQKCDNVQLKPVTLHYYFTEKQKPVAAICVGDAIRVDGKTKTKKEWTLFCENLLNMQRIEQINDLTSDPDLPFQFPYKKIGKEGKSTSDRFDQIFKRGRT